MTGSTDNPQGSIANPSNEAKSTDASADKESSAGAQIDKKGATSAYTAVDSATPGQDEDSRVERLDQTNAEEEEEANEESDDDDFPRFGDTPRGRIAGPVAGQKPNNNRPR